MIVSGGAARGPYPYRWMLFVDGENLTIRAQELAKGPGVGWTLQEGPHYMHSVYIWLPSHDPRRYFGASEIPGLRPVALRAYYYTSAVGDDATLQDIRRKLRDLKFDPQVFKKDKATQKTKGVDVTLTKDMLSGAFRDNYDAAVLVAGDADYLPLIREVKRLGKLVCGAFFTGSGLSPEIPLTCDHFWELDVDFAAAWRA